MRSLELVHEQKLYRLLPGYDSDSRLEASGIQVLGDHFYVVFDNLSEIAALDRRLTHSGTHRMVGARVAGAGWEDITYDDRHARFYLLRETVRSADGQYRSTIAEVDHTFVAGETHPLPFVFAHENSGFEGVACVQRGGETFLLALCEGNFCGGKRGPVRHGGGRIQVFQRGAQGWLHCDTLHVPASVAFEDYAALDLRERRLVLVSQQSRRVWLGTLADDAWRFVDEGTTYRFPRDADHKERYCTVEGIAWLAHNRLVAVSDRRKRGASAGRCADKDQSIHVFEMPPP